MATRTQLSRLGLFDAKVPRYTSYPTSPHFSDSVQPGHFTHWIESIPEGSQISLYLHVPFCRRLCWFCACRTQGTASGGPVTAYVETLKDELTLLKRHLPKGVTLSRLHWGGGTPTLLSPDHMRDLSAAIREVADFAQGYEFSVEIDPNEIDAPRLEALFEAGMNRASIGVQDFDPHIQKTIGREQSFETTKRAVDMIRERGIQSLNADILYGLPDQTRARIVDSVQKLLSLSPDRVALYGYAHVPWMAKRQQMIPSDALPRPDERLDLFETAGKLFVWDNYDEIGIDHFATKEDGLSVAARNGTLRRNFQGYTDDTSDVLVGLGASSISKFPQGYAQNAPATSSYTKAIRANTFSTVKGHSFSEQDKLRARMIEMLMCDFRVRTDELVQNFDTTKAEVQAILNQTNAEFENLLKVDDTGMFVPKDARPLTRMVARSFDAYDLSSAGHSSAI
ncbi:oxygen-independent coproporphyrinogen III oxidase [Marivita sp. S6314]|uniref:oxygen-independent coproporphyrinogen III oxidase n=1 Tax=Marivita sp. S6314 TaxID=2926406 RepID=UPI001FF287BD|nr:oxygen-independent coproporphyrinogen III oxidase [Marivita sp. S6314]MCK0149862.1 oxygen-independent coproporphyrinogen III oxidase [Marivita sp. S6314]